MAYAIQAGIQISIDGTTWYRLTDHNRQPIQVDVELIENESRMANGSLRKYIVAKKHKVSTSWTFLPTKTTETADGNYGAAWIESFYKANAAIPIHLKVIESKISTDPSLANVPNEFNFKTSLLGSTEYDVFITSFSKTISKRSSLSDYVDMNIEFTEI